MNQEWSLDVLYHGYEDPKFDEDMKKFESEVAGMKEKIEAMGQELGESHFCLRFGQYNQY